jgi:tubulin-specific chaperone B
LELITGAQNQSMKIHVHDERGKKLFELDDNQRTLGSYDVQSKMILHVEETNLKRAHMFDDTGDVPKYELTDDEYRSRKNTTRQFLQENRIGKYNPTVQEEYIRKEREKEELEQQLACQMHVNDR